MAFSAFLAGVGLALLAVAADQLVLGAGRVAARLRIAPIIVGVVVIGLGTSAPEFLVSGLAAGQGNIGLAIGNLTGSNILNLTLILGITAVIRPIPVAGSVVRREAPLAVGAMAVLAVFAWVGLGPAAGVLLAAATVAALVLLVRLARGGPDRALAADVSEFLGEPPRHPAAGEAARTIVGLAGVLAGAQLLVANATRIATELGVSQVVIGFTLVAAGTSLPELVTGIQAQRRGESDLLVGNLLGSNLFNSLAGGAVVGLATGRHNASARWPLLAAMVLVGLLAWALLARRRTLTRLEGLLLLGTYASTLPLLR